MNIPEKEITDCGTEGCGECDVCQYLAHLEHAASVMPGNGEFGMTVERNERIEGLLDEKYPQWRKG